MSTDTLRSSGPIAADQSERSALDKVESLFVGDAVPKLIGTEGEEIQLPDSVARLLRQLVYYLAHDRAVAVVPVNKELSTQEAADILNVSRPYLVKLLEQGEIPFVKVGAHRRIQVRDLMEYQRLRDATRRQALQRLTQMSQELGLYE